MFMEPLLWGTFSGTSHDGDSEVNKGECVSSHLMLKGKSYGGLEEHPVQPRHVQMCKVKAEWRTDGHRGTEGQGLGHSSPLFLVSTLLCPPPSV